MVRADENRPRKGPGPINGKPPGKKKGKRARQAGQKSGPTPDASPSVPEELAPEELVAEELVATTEIVPDTIEPMEQPVAAAETPDAPAEMIAEPAKTVAVSARTISDAYGDYTRKSIAQTSSFFAQLAGARSPNKAFELQTEFARTAFETFVDESRKIRELHRELTKQRLQNLEGFVMGKRATR